MDAAAALGDAPAALLRELPTRPTQRACKLAADLEQASKELDERGFAGQPAEDQHAALSHFHDTWQGIRGAIKELQHHTMQGVLGQLQQWAAATAARPDDQQQPAAGGLQDALPVAALSVASSTNTAEAYADMLVTLRQQGHPTALVGAREVGAGLTAVLNSALRQFLATPGTAADDVPALLAWWQDEHERCYGSNTAAAAAAAAGSSKRGGGGGGGSSKTPQKRPPAPAAAMEVDQPAGTPPPSSRRELRARTPAAAGKTPLLRGKAGEPAAAGAARAPLQAPVLVLQDADSGDADAVQELVVALHEARKVGLPLVLVLGINTSQAGLLQLLPNSLMRRIQLLQLSLPPARQQLARFYRSVLLQGPQPRLVLGPSSVAWLLSHFRDVDSSASMAQRALQLACVEHFQQQPLSCLAAAAASGSRRALSKAVRRLDPPQLARCCRALLAAAQATALTDEAAAADGGPTGSSAAARAAQAAAVAHLQALVDGRKPQRGGSSGSPSRAAAAAGAVLEGAVWAAAGAFQRWRLGVLTLSLLANFTGAADVDASFQLPALYASASQAGFLAASRRGALTPCGKLLLRVLGASSTARGSAGGDATAAAAAAGGGSGARPVGRGGVVPVESLSDAECAELAGKLLVLLRSALLSHTRGKAAAPQGGTDGHDAAGSDASSSDASSGSDSDSDDDSSASDSNADSDAGRQGPTPATSWPGAQQLLSACEALQAAATAAAGAAADGDANGCSAAAEALAVVCATFEWLLVPLPEQLQLAAPPASAAAGPGAGGEEEGMDAAEALGLCSTPAGAARTAARGGSGSGGTPLMTPGGLASQLRRHVTFAPDTPDHAGVKAAGRGGRTSSGKSTPDEEAGGALAGLSKTPNKRTPGGKGKPRKKLFDPQAAAAAAAAAAAGGGSQRGSSRRKEKKQEAEVGEIAGSSVAALAGAVAAAAGGGGGATAAAAATSNKRQARLLNLLVGGTPPPVGAPGAAAATGAAAAGSSRDGSGRAAAERRAAGSARHARTTPASAAQVVVQQQPGLLLSPMPSDAEATLSPHPSLLPTSAPASSGAVTTAARPSRLRASSSRAAAAGDGGGDDAAVGADGSGDGGSRAARSSRLSRQSRPTLATHTHENEDDAVGMEVEQQQEVEQAAGAPAMQQQHEEEQAPGPVRCSTVLARLLNATIPRLLLDWACPTSADNSCLLGSSAEQPAAAGASLAAAGARAFVYDDAQLLEAHLAPAAPASVHAALVAPALRLPGHPLEPQEPGWEDTCLAYVLLQQQRDDGMPVSDWFGLFCEAVGVAGYSRFPAPAAAAAAFADDEEAGAGSAAAAAAAGGVGTDRAAKARARAGRKAKGYAEARDGTAAAAAAAAAAGGGADAGAAKAPGGRRGQQQQQQQLPGLDQDDKAAPSSAAKAGRKRRSSTAAAGGADGCDDDDTGRGQQQQPAAAAAGEVDQQALLAAAARFSQATAELQLLGVWKGTKRRRAAGVLRVFAPEAHALPSMAAAAAALAARGADDDDDDDVSGGADRAVMAAAAMDEDE